jgi:hypothetical protein
MPPPRSTMLGASFRASRSRTAKPRGACQTFRRPAAQLVRPRRCDPHPPGCLHQSPRASSRKQSTVRVPNPHLRTPGSRESVPAAASKQRCNWRERFLSGSSPLKHARIAITRDTVRQAHAAAIVGVERDESSGSQPVQVPWGAVLSEIEIDRQLLT